MDVEKFKNLSPAARKELLRSLNIQIWGYPKWDSVLQHFGLPPQEPSKKLCELVDQLSFGRRGGESEEHKALKQFVAHNPHIFGLKKSQGITEYRLPSGDEIDVLFKFPDHWAGVEVKGPNSDEADLLRGIFQCIKYQVLIEAEQRITGQAVGARVILAIGGSLTSELRAVRDLFEINVVERLRVPALIKQKARAAGA